MVRSPQHTKKGTLMPGLFTGDEGNAKDVEALTEYLSSLIRPPSAALETLSGDSESGKRLYHQVGCVACHEPATDYRPPAAPRGTEIEEPGLASVPLVLAEAYAPEELASFLQNPLHIRPSGRMPAQQLTAQEAADITAYLQFGETFEPSVERAVLQVPLQGIDRGRSVFSKLNCQACHQMGSDPYSPTKKVPLIALDPRIGCLSESRQSGVPFYQLNPTQRRAIQLSMEVIQKRPTAPTAFDPLGWRLARLNCYACHDRDGKGGPEDPRAQYFSQEPLPETPGFHPYPMPPSLDGVENSLNPDELRAALRGRPSPSGNVTVRMPNFGESNAEDLFTHFRKAASEPSKFKGLNSPSN